MQKTIVVARVDVPLLKLQRDELVELAMGQRYANEVDLDGIINMLDYMLDVADGIAGPPIINRKME